MIHHDLRQDVQATSDGTLLDAIAEALVSGETGNLGSVLANRRSVCPACRGVAYGPPEGPYEVQFPCWQCGGTGKAVAADSG